LRRGLRKLHLVFLRQPWIAMAPGAGLREVQLENRRRRVLHRQNAMRAVTIPAIGGAGSSQLVAQAVDARGVIFRLLFMASGAVGRRQFGVVDEFLDAGVAVRAIEHGMDGPGEAVGGKDGERDGFAIHLPAVGRVGVAIQAIGVRQFFDGVGGGESRRCEWQAKQDEEAGEDSPHPVLSCVDHPFHKPRSRPAWRGQSAHSFPEKDQRRLTSSATVQGHKS